MIDEPANPATEAIPFSQFLESTAPYVCAMISDLFTTDGNSTMLLSAPDIQLHCGSDSCGGIRTFRCVSDAIPLGDLAKVRAFIDYACGNCTRSVKVFALVAQPVDGGRGLARKVGEVPSFGPPTSLTTISLAGEDRDLFLQARRAENFGLGMGALAYYSKVVESQAGRIAGELGKAAQQMGAALATLAAFARAEKESQLGAAVEAIGNATPEALLIHGHNPLALLERAIDAGRQETNDTACLELAKSIRLVLTELAARLEHSGQDRAELNEAVQLLLRQTKSVGSSGGRK